LKRKGNIKNHVSHLLFSICLFILLSFAFCLCGCGGDKDKAKQLVISGERILISLKSDSENFTKGFTDVQKLLESQKQISSTEISARLNMMDESAKRIVSGYIKARKEFSKVLGLKGVTDYANYSELRIKGLEKLTELTEKTLNYLHFVEEIVVRQEKGEEVDPVESFTRIQQFAKAFDQLSKEVDKLAEDANDLRKEKRLF